MKGSTQAAFALGLGYVLGRRRKLRMATVMAGGMAVGAVGGLGGMAVKRGAKALGNTEMLSKMSPQLTEIVDTVRGDLLDAGRAAAAAAVTSRLDSITGSLHDRAETLRNPEAAAGEAGRAAKGARDGAGRVSQRLRRRGRAEDDEAVDEQDDESAPLDEDDEPRDEDEERRGDDELSDEDDEPRDEDEPRGREADDDYDEPYEAEDEADTDDLADGEDAEEPGDEDEPPARPRRSRSTRSRSPVTRTRR